MGILFQVATGGFLDLKISEIVWWATGYILKTGLAEAADLVDRGDDDGAKWQ